MFCFACGTTNKTTEREPDKDTLTIVQKPTPAVNEETSPKQLEPSDATPSLQVTGESIFTKATILSVTEELIMPSDYLTAAMAVRTATNDTLVFLDMYGFEKLVNQEISIQYKITAGTKSLVCFNCTAYTEEIQSFDVSSFMSDVAFETFQLKEYIEDPYITIASTFTMLKKDGSTEEFYSNNTDLVSDSIKMASSFYSYGIVTKLYPELENREELEELIK